MTIGKIRKVTILVGLMVLLLAQVVWASPSPDTFNSEFVIEDIEVSDDLEAVYVYAKIEIVDETILQANKSTFVSVRSIDNRCGVLDSKVIQGDVARFSLVALEDKLCGIAVKAHLEADVIKDEDIEFRVVYAVSDEMLDSAENLSQWQVGELMDMPQDPIVNFVPSQVVEELDISEKESKLDLMGVAFILVTIVAIVSSVVAFKGRKQNG